MPLSCSVPLDQSRFCDVATHIKATRASKGLTEAVHSFAHGRAIAYNDPEVLEHEAEARGLDSGVVMEGNLFARSTWERFTLSALDARGMRTTEEEARVADQGLCMRLRVRNHRSAAGHDDADPALDAQVEAQPHTFTAPGAQKAQAVATRTRTTTRPCSRFLPSAAAWSASARRGCWMSRWTWMRVCEEL